MKLKNILFIMIILTITSCEKNDNSNNDYEWSKVTALRNGLAWEAGCGSIIFRDINSDSIIFTASVENSQGFRREYLTINNIPSSIGKYEISDSTEQRIISASFATLLADGDVLGDIYSVLDEFDNYIEIDFIDWNEGIYSGTFEITFKRNDNEPDSSLPDTLYFSNGIFHSRIFEE